MKQNGFFLPKPVCTIPYILSWGGGGETGKIPVAGLLFNLVPVDDDLDDSVPNLKDKRKQHTKMSPILEFYKKKFLCCKSGS